MLSPGEEPRYRSSGTPGIDDVSTRSTRDPLVERRPGPGRVLITVQKLPEPPCDQSQGQKPGSSASSRPAAEARAAPPGGDLVTTRFACGYRGAALEELKQRSHSASRSKEVRVQLLDAPAPSLQQPGGQAVGVRAEEGPSSGLLGEGANAAAAAAAAAVAAAVAATAPIMKAQLEMELRMSQLVGDVQKLMHRDRGRSLCPETQKNHQLQSQLLESAFHIPTSHAPTTSNFTAAVCPTHLQVTHLDTADVNIVADWPKSSMTTTASAAMETSQVAMETLHHSQRLQQTRDDRRLRGPKEESTDSPTNHSKEAASRANQVLREMRQFRAEMKTLLKPDDFLKTSRAAQGPPHSQLTQSQQNLVQLQQSQQDQVRMNWVQQDQVQQNRVNPSQVQQSQIHPDPVQPDQLQQNRVNLNQLQPDPIERSQSILNQSPLYWSHLNRPQTQNSKHSRGVEIQRRPVAPSPLEAAAQVLHQVRRQRKLFDENLNSALRSAKAEGLCTNRDWTQQARITKTVDAWINLQPPEVSVENAVDSRAANAAVTSQQRVTRSSAPFKRGMLARGPKQTGSEALTRNGVRGQTEAAPQRGRRSDSHLEAEAYLTQLYGRPPYEWPPASPHNRKSRPCLVKSVGGVKLKSRLTPASAVAPPPSWIPPVALAPPFTLYTVQPHLCSPPPPPSDDPTDWQHPIYKAIALGPPRLGCSRPWRPPAEMAPPTCPSAASMVATDDRATDDRAAECQQRDTDEAPPPPVTSHTVNIMETRSEEDEEDKENVFPGTDFLSVADIVQEEESVAGEDAVEVDGGPSTPPVQYQGPVFPPQAPAALRAQDQDPILDFDVHRDALVHRLVEWVEQQVMPRVILEMIPPPLLDPTGHCHTEQSGGEEQSIASDIVEAAGVSDLQQFGDLNSEVVQQAVIEVLTEIVASMLGQKEEPSPSLRSGPGPSPSPDRERPRTPEQEKVLLTPALTPPTSPAPPTSSEATPIATPPPSEPASLLIEEPAQSTTPERVATPTPSPEPTSSAGSPMTHQAPPTSNWPDVELPLDEEKPEEDLNTRQQTLLMSVAEEEPPLSSPLPPSRSPPPEAEPAPPSTSSEESSSSSLSCSSSSSSSTAVTAGTEAAVKHISEGEVLISVNQQAAMTEAEAACSFCSSLQEFEEMDFDPLSEGQVKGRGLSLSLLTKSRVERPQSEASWGGVEQGEVKDDDMMKPGRGASLTSPGQISQAAGLTEEPSPSLRSGPGQGPGPDRERPRTPEQEEVLLTPALTPPTSPAPPTSREESLMSPGQISQAADVSEPSTEGSHQIPSVTVNTAMQLSGH